VRRARRRRHRGRAIAATALITAGLVIIADVLVTLLWQEPISAAYALLRQRQLEDEFERLRERYGVRGERRDRIAGAGAVRRSAASLARAAERGEAIGRIRIPEIDLEITMVEGTDAASLQEGPGHYPETAMPGEGETVAIAGHRTTYLAPFRHIDELERGDGIAVEMPYGEFGYTVERTRIVAPTRVGVIRSVGEERIVLTACHPLYSAAERIVVFAGLAASDPAPRR
jgi:sortase A